ncbi:MAG: hypothetical protein ACM3WV_02730 [Bacillota bacterium]
MKTIMIFLLAAGMVLCNAIITPAGINVYVDYPLSTDVAGEIPSDFFMCLVSAYARTGNCFLYGEAGFVKAAESYLWKGNTYLIKAGNAFAGSKRFILYGTGGYTRFEYGVSGAGKVISGILAGLDADLRMQEHLIFSAGAGYSLSAEAHDGMAAFPGNVYISIYQARLSFILGDQLALFAAYRSYRYRLETFYHIEVSDLTAGIGVKI